MAFFTNDWPCGGENTNRIYLFKIPGVSFEPERFPWPMSCHDPHHTNNLTYRMPTDINDDNISIVPGIVSLDQNYPNPFNSVTTINYSLKEGGHVDLKIYNLLGQQVGTLMDENQKAGNYSVSWDAKKSSSGIYYYKLKANDVESVKRMVLLK
jgi:hypothetical protein